MCVCKGEPLHWGCMLGPDLRAAYPEKRDPLVAAPLHGRPLESGMRPGFLALAARFPQAEFRWVDIEEDPPERAAARGAAQVKIEAMVPWIASAAARGSAASRTGRPTTM